MKKISIILVILVLIIGGFYLYKNQQKEDFIDNKKETVKIGIILPLSGNIGFIGNWHKQGFDLAFKNIDTSKYNIEIYYQDSKNNAREGLNAYNFLKRKNVDIIISAMSNVSIPLMEKSKKDKIPLFVTSVSYPEFAQKSKYAFRYNITSDKEGTICSNEIVKHYKSVNLFYINDQYGDGAKNAFIEAANKNNLNISTTESFEVNQKDFKNVLAKFNQKDVVYVAGYGRSYVTLLKQLMLRTKRDTIYSVYGMDFPEFRKPLIGTNKIIGYTKPLKYENKSFNKFEKEFKSKFNKEPNLVNVFSYDLLTMISKIINENGKNINLNNVINHSYGKSLYGYELTIDSNGEITVPLELKYIHL